MLEALDRSVLEDRHKDKNRANSLCRAGLGINTATKAHLKYTSGYIISSIQEPACADPGGAGLTMSHSYFQTASRDSHKALTDGKRIAHRRAW